MRKVRNVGGGILKPVVFKLTPEQEKIVLPMIKRAEKDYDKCEPGMVLFQIVRNNRCGEMIAEGRYAPNKTARKIQDALMEEHDNQKTSR